jgi:hypothetical protein
MSENNSEIKLNVHKLTISQAFFNPDESMQQDS